MLPPQIIYITIVVSLVGTSFYIRDILRGKTKPNFVSWFFWMLAPFVGVFLQLKAGAGLSALPIFMAGFIPFLVLVVSLIKGNAYWKITFFDVACGIFAFIALILWILTKNTDLSIVFAILADALASVPTLVKSYKFPETETSSVYIAGVFNNLLGLLIIKEWDFSVYSFGIWLVLLNIVLVFFIRRKRVVLEKII